MHEQTSSPKVASTGQSHHDVLEQALIRRVNDQVERVESELDLLKQVVADLIERRPSQQRRTELARTTSTSDRIGRVPFQARPEDLGSGSGPSWAQAPQAAESVSFLAGGLSDAAVEDTYVDVEPEPPQAELEAPQAQPSTAEQIDSFDEVAAGDDHESPVDQTQWFDDQDASDAEHNVDVHEQEELPGFGEPTSASATSIDDGTPEAEVVLPPAGTELNQVQLDPVSPITVVPADEVLPAPTSAPVANLAAPAGPSFDLAPPTALADPVPAAAPSASDESEIAEPPGLAEAGLDVAHDVACIESDVDSDVEQPQQEVERCTAHQAGDTIGPCEHSGAVAPSSAQCAWAAEVGAAVMRVANNSKKIPEPLSKAASVATPDSSTSAQDPCDTAESDEELAAGSSSVDGAPVEAQSFNEPQPTESDAESSEHSTIKPFAGFAEASFLSDNGVFGHKTAHELVPVEKPLSAHASPKERWAKRFEHQWRAAGFRCTVDSLSTSEAELAGLHAAELAYRSDVNVVIVAATADWQAWWHEKLTASLPEARTELCNGNPHVLQAADIAVLCADDKVVSHVCANAGQDVCLIAQDVYDYGADAQQDVLTAPASWRLALVHGDEDSTDVLGRAMQRYFGDECFAVDPELSLDAELTRPFRVFRADILLPKRELQEYNTLQVEMVRYRERLYRLGADPDDRPAFVDKVRHWLIGHGGQQAQSLAEEYVAARDACARYTADSSVKVETLAEQAEVFAAQGTTLVYSDKLRPGERVAAAINSAGGSARAVPSSRFGLVKQQVDAAVLLSPGLSVREFARRVAAVREPHTCDAPANVVVAHLGGTHEQSAVEDRSWDDLLKNAADVQRGTVVELARWLDRGGR